MSSVLLDRHRSSINPAPSAAAIPFTTYDAVLTVQLPPSTSVQQNLEQTWQTHCEQLPEALFQSLLHRSHQEAAEVAMLLLAALAAFSCRYARQDTIPLAFAYPHVALAEELPHDGAAMPWAQTDLTLDKYVSLHHFVQQVTECLRSPTTFVAPPHDGISFAYRRIAAAHTPGCAARQTPTAGSIGLTVCEHDQQLWLHWCYRTAHFDQTAVARLQQHFVTFLAAVLNDPNQPLCGVPLLTVAERQQLLVAWNTTAAPFPAHACVHQLVEHQARLQPDAAALVFGASVLSYGELNSRANRLAHYLRRHGVGVESLVGVCLDRSIDMVVALLAVLKAGAAYVPLDPAYPSERLSFMMQDAQLAVVLTRRATASIPMSDSLVLAETNQSGQPLVIALEESRAQINKEPDANMEATAGPEHLAYIIYTSGSTGQPKGVLLQHLGLTNLVWGQIEVFAITATSRVLQFASLSFDASVSEIFTTLVAGATLVLAQRDTLMSPATLLALLRDMAITTVTLPPSLLAMMPSENLPALETVVSAGESCSWEVALRWSQGRRFLNAYGPTEATVGPTAHVVDGRVPGTHSVPIGRPLPNMQIYILDQHQQPLPVGVPGEVYIAGVGLARGYLNQPELTAQKFVEVAFDMVDCTAIADAAHVAEAVAASQRVRLYRTGDMARFLADGTIEFLGRIDHQVKLRGFRVELGEIESVLRQHPTVQDAVVTVREDSPGDQRLVGYVTPQTAQSLELWPSVAEYFVYDEVLYHAMTHDKRRNESYLVALRQAVPGKVVLDIGTGRDAILARLAVQAGARKVYAVELLEESYQHAQATIAKLGLTDKITLIKGNIQHISLPEPIDVCVSEIVGAIGGSEGARIIINDAWKFLRPGGTMIPGRSVTEIAAVSLPEALTETPAFSQLARHYVEQIFTQRGYRFDLRLCLKGVRRDDLLSTSGVLEDLDFTATESVEYNRTERLVVTRAGRIDGLLAWLNLYTTPDERIDILDHEHCWIPVFFPVFSPGVQVQPGDSIELVISSRPCENGLNPDYFIEGQLLRQNEAPLHFSYRSYHYAPRYRQTPFYQRLFGDNQLPLATSAIASPKTSELRTYLQKQLPGYMVPSSLVVLPALPLTANGKVDRKALPAPAEVAEEATSIVAPRSPEEALLVGIWASVLGRSSISIHDDFFELGGYSLLAARAVTLVNAALKRNIPLRLLFNAPTVASFAAAILNDKKATPNHDLASDIWLDSSITASPNRAEQPVYPPQAIFVTGATGFVGAFLLAELLAQTNATIYCLVRAHHAHEARWRIQQTFAEYQIQAPHVDHRIVPVVGDLSKPSFGLSEAAFQQLGETIDCIYHAGALVNYLHPYENLKATNVQGTVEVLRLATIGRTSPVHFVSTLAVTIAGSGGNHVYEDDEPLCPHVAMGYDQSKWVADGIMRLARSRGIPVAIYRPGRIGSHSHTGASNRDDFFIRLLGSCLQLGLAPNIPMVENIMPVDFVARAIVHLSQQQQHANKTFHLLNQASLHWQWLMEMIQEQGYRLRLVSYPEWYQALQNRAGYDPEHPLHTFVKLLPTGDVAERWLANLHHQAATGQWYATLSLADAIYIDSLSNQAFAMHNTLDGLAGTGLVSSAFDAVMLKRILAEGERQGIFTSTTDMVNMSVARLQQRRSA